MVISKTFTQLIGFHEIYGAVNSAIFLDILLCQNTWWVNDEMKCWANYFSAFWRYHFS